LKDGLASSILFVRLKIQAAVSDEMTRVTLAGILAMKHRKLKLKPTTTNKGMPFKADISYEANHRIGTHLSKTRIETTMAAFALSRCHAPHATLMAFRCSCMVVNTAKKQREQVNATAIVA
jgi:hypothetical protein